MDIPAGLPARLAYLQTVVGSSDDAVIGVDADGCITSWNRGAHRLFGHESSFVNGTAMAALIPEHDRPLWVRILAQALAGSTVERVELSLQRRDGSPIDGRLIAAPVRSESGGENASVLGVCLLVRDVSEQRLAQATLAESAQRVAESEALAHVGSWAWDVATDAVQWSAEQHRIHGIAPQDFSGSLAAQLDRVHPAHRPLVARALQAAVRIGAPFEEEFRIVRPDQSVRWVSSRASLVVGASGERLGLRGIYHDITERHETAQVLQQANERLTQLALYDRLTGLPNRVLLLDRLGQSLVRGRQDGLRVDLMYLGIDDFKTINDSAGHGTGDQVLRALTPLLGQALRTVGMHHRSSGRLLARLGGDEFAIVLDDGDPQRIADGILGLLTQPLNLPDDQVFINVSIGHAHVSAARQDVTPEALVAEANIAMHEAKRSGAGRFVSFEPRMHEAVRSRHQLGHELRRALAEEQFVVRYQPIVDLSTGEVTGAEALVRWEHPTRGLVGPNSFIPRAEETGVIVPLGAWVLQEACRQAAEWHRATGTPLSLAVNVSGRQLREPGFVDTVRAALSTAGLPATSLCLEMTESILMERDTVGLAMLNVLREDGVHLAIDDFGTGYSSLAALRGLPVDQLKIDRSFVAGLPGDGDAATIAWAIVHLGHALGLRVLAEGVETAAQRAELLRFGCDLAQGFLFGRGVSSQELVRACQSTAVPPLPRKAETVAERQR